LNAQHILFGVGCVVSDQEVGMSRIINCARTGLAAGVVTLLMSHAAFAAQINIHVPTPVIRVPTPVIHLPPPDVRVLVPSARIKTPEINVDAGRNLPVDGRLHNLGDQKRDFNSGNSGGVDGLVEGNLSAVSKVNQSALKSAAHQLQSNIGVSYASKLLSKQTSTRWSELGALRGKGIYQAATTAPTFPTLSFEKIDATGKESVVFAVKEAPDADISAEVLNGNLPAGGDVVELAYTVLMRATNDQNNDLKEIMNEVQAQTNSPSGQPAPKVVREALPSFFRKIEVQ
jgi:hypothetical protein